jgi:hypothetical protein
MEDEEPGDSDRVNGAVASIVVGVPIMAFLIVVAVVIMIAYGG